MGLHFNFVRDVPQDLQCLPRISATYVVEDVSVYGHSDFGILSDLGASSNFTWVYADTTSAACPSQSSNLAITSITFAAVIWHAYEPRLVKKLCRIQSLFFKCHHGGARLCLCIFVILVLTPSSWIDILSINVAKWTFFFVSLSFENTLLLTLDFFHSPCWNCRELFPFLVHCSFCIQNLHCFVLSVLLSRWFFEDKCLMRPTFPNPQSEYLFPNSSSDQFIPKKDTK